MKPFIICLAISVAITNFSFAGSGNPSRVNFPTTFTAVLKEKKSPFEDATAKVCACQILRVTSNNENEKLIAVFAQGNNNGDISADLSTANSVLEKEKKHLKNFFYSKIKTAENVTAATPCSQLYKNIQVKYANVKLYEVLDADALSDKKVSNR